MDRTAFKSPLPCFGNELDLHDPRCQACPHQAKCGQYMGNRLNRVPLSQLVFHFVPDLFKDKIPLSNDAVNERTDLQKTYTLCFWDIFQKPTNDSVSLYADAILRAARSKKCSVRLFMHAAMIGYDRHQDTIIGHTDHAYSKHCHPKFLTTARAASYVDMYRELCVSKYGSFGLHEIDYSNKSQYLDTTTHERLLRSEITAGKYLVAAKASTGGPIEPDFYFSRELHLDVNWLVIEPSYTQHVLKEYTVRPYGTKAQRQHRSDTLQAIARLKGNKAAGIAIHKARAQIMPKAIAAVLALHRFHPDEFESLNEPVTNAFSFWKDVGRLIQHLYCLRLYSIQVEPAESSSS